MLFAFAAKPTPGLVSAEVAIPAALVSYSFSLLGEVIKAMTACTTSKFGWCSGPLADGG